MNNREKVIRAIEKAKKQSEEYAQDRIIVPFREADMILALLKEQEAMEQCIKTKCVICPHCDHCDVDENGRLKEQKAVEPVTESSVYDPDTWFFVCGSCKKGVVEREDKYCRWCGQAVKWND